MYQTEDFKTQQQYLNKQLWVVNVKGDETIMSLVGYLGLMPVDVACGLVIVALWLRLFSR